MLLERNHYWEIIFGQNLAHWTKFHANFRARSLNELFSLICNKNVKFVSSRIKISDPILTERANLAHWRHERREEKEGLEEEEEAREEEK